LPIAVVVEMTIDAPITIEVLSAAPESYTSLPYFCSVLAVLSNRLAFAFGQIAGIISAIAVNATFIYVRYYFVLFCLVWDYLRLRALRIDACT
jgi:hypothetical protein